ncbi:MAG TPA: hypothetical protein VG796_23800 [Verrucomicrobiales bacterium]|nr:hypothetical protein [Verrucomicrobiales bacterium]
MPPKLLRKIFIALAIPFVLFELVCWIFMPFPVEPLRALDISNDIPGFKQKVRVITGADQMRYLDWTAGDKPEGTVRILCIGGFATQGILQAAEDTWWGKLHSRLKGKGLKVQTAARGFDRTGVILMATLMTRTVERLKPDVIILNSGFDDVIIHPGDYVYDKEKFSKLPIGDPPPAWKQFLLKVSQTARFMRYRTKDSETNKLQNELGRRDVYKKFFDEKRAAIQRLPRHPGFPRAGIANDPLQEYLDGLAAFRDLAAKNNASLILTGEPTLFNRFMNIAESELLLAYISSNAPKEDGTVSDPRRPEPEWVISELTRYAGAAEKFAADNKLPWLDLNGQVDRSTTNFFSDVILTDAGAEAAAAVIEPVVEPVVRAKAGK